MKGRQINGRGVVSRVIERAKMIGTRARERLTGKKAQSLRDCARESGQERIAGEKGFVVDVHPEGAKKMLSQLPDGTRLRPASYMEQLERMRPVQIVEQGFTVNPFTAMYDSISRSVATGDGTEIRVSRQNVLLGPGGVQLWSPKIMELFEDSGTTMTPKKVSTEIHITGSIIGKGDIGWSSVLGFFILNSVEKVNLGGRLAVEPTQAEIDQFKQEVFAASIRADVARFLLENPKFKE